MATDLTSLSNSDLDDYYANADRQGDIQARTLAGFEIENRMGGMLGFVESGVGYSPFPQYEAIQARLGRQTDAQNAQGSIHDAAANVVTTVEQGAKTVLGYSLAGLAVTAVLVGLGIAIYFKVKKSV